MSMTTEELAAAVRQYALDNYENGWDTLIECHTRQEVIEAVGKAKTVPGAIANVNKKLGIMIYHEHRLEIEAEIF